jgi:hypothetical protein
MDAERLLGGAMDCLAKNELELHLSDIRKLASHDGLAPEEKEAAARAERFAIAMVKAHDKSGHEGKRCPLATQV